MPLKFPGWHGCSELEARSEAELDERLHQLHYRIEHESIPLNEEKRILQLIKKLEGQRSKVELGLVYQTGLIGGLVLVAVVIC